MASKYMNKNLLSNTPKSPMAKAKRLMELQAIIKEIKPEIDQLKEDLLKVTQDLGVLTLKTEGYTISRAKKITPHVIDFETLKNDLDKKKIPYSTKLVFDDYMKEVFKKAIDEGRELEGLEGLETEYIMVRINKNE